MSSERRSAKAGSEGSGRRLYRLKVSLRDVRPGVWRSVLVAPETTLKELHTILQGAMGWERFHLYRFGWTMRMDGRVVGDSWWTTFVDDEGDESPVEDVSLEVLDLQAGDTMAYVYDMGDYWVHDIRVESRPYRKKGKRHPRVLDGRGACPPEDCGGPEIYPVLVKLARGKGPVKGELREWGIGRMVAREELGKDFDARHFDPGEANDLLKWYRQT